MNRGQVLYRVAELLEGRRDQFEAEVAAAEGLDAAAAREQVDRSIDRWVWYAGWADKISQVLGTVNPVGADYFDFTIPEATGVVGVVAPEGSSLLGLVSRLAPVVVSGNTAVVLASEAPAAAGRDARGGAGHERRAGRRHQPHHRPAAGAGALAGGAHGRQRASTPRACRPTCGRRSRRPPSRTSSASPGRRAGDADRFDWLDDRARAAPRVDRRVPGDEDRLAPHRPLSQVSMPPTRCHRAATRRIPGA